MIKILFFIETLEGGGAEKVLRNLVNHMDQSKFDITVQTVWPCEAERYLQPGIRYRTVYPKRSVFYEKLYRAETAAGMTYPLHIRDNYDIECAYLEMGATKIMAGSTNKAAKKLAWVHCDLRRAMADPRAFAEKTRQYYEKFDRVICVSQNVQDSFVALFGNGIPSQVLYNTVDDAEIRRKAAILMRENAARTVPVVAAAGRLTEAKNYLRLLRAHRQLLSEGIPHVLWILGEGEQRGILEQYIAANGLAETVKLFGFCDNPYPYLANADILACSSDWEGFSTFVTEGLILGKPIVTTECSGMRELLGDSEYGLITERSDAGFYGGLRRLLADQVLREKYGRRAAERGTEFSVLARAVQTEKMFDELIG